MLRFALLLCCAVVLPAQSPARYMTGNPADSTTKTRPGLLLSGGGGDVEEAFRWLIERSGGGDVVVIRSSGADGYNGFIPRLGKVDSVESIVLTAPEHSRDQSVIDAIRNAEALFIAGGDQWNYVRLWKGTPIEDAIHHVYEKGAPVGGSSAGLAVLGEFAFSAQFDTVTSAQALADPFDKRVAIERDFLRFPPLKGIITDSHFSRRDRMGRLLVWLARLGEARGIGIDEATTVLVDPDGTARVVGKGAAYFVRPAGPAPECRPGTPLTGAAYDVQKVPAGASFELKAWKGAGAHSYRLIVDAGVVRAEGNPSVY